ncbi:MAG: diaminopimelate decarboxylase [Muribaculaceae bacterium]|nr:diaminopimelate decarboxylase [Muribaculaceae bacterium]
MKLRFPLKEFQQMETPFYYYDMSLLDATIKAIKKEIKDLPYEVHYAVKANGNPTILKAIAAHGLGVDLVSGGEIAAALEAGFKPSGMVYSGVGKTDREIIQGLEAGIYSFNVESIPELMVINQLAQERGLVAPVSIRVNPDIDAHTHRYITTGTAEDKFGINIEMLAAAVQTANSLPAIHLRGLHFHVGSQITQMKPFAMLCESVNTLLDYFDRHDISFEIINVGGGLGIDYDMPDVNRIPDFQHFFDTFRRNLKLREGQELHFELGRSIVAQCGSLIARVVYVKENRNKKFVILDAGMTDLIRPALYEAHHVIQNLTSQDTASDTYDVVGPICESSDVFGKDERLPVSHRGDIFALRSAGAYGESMASQYNMRRLPGTYFDE